MAFINLTPHNVVIYHIEDTYLLDGRYLLKDEAKPAAMIKPSGKVARAAMHREVTDIVTVNGLRVPVSINTYGEPLGLPDKVADGDRLIVSVVTAKAARACGHPAADKCLVVDRVIRDPDGNILGCSAFCTVE